MDLSDFANSGSNVTDFGKKKPGNRYSKLKQTKLDARREQWLAQVKSKGGKEESEPSWEVLVDVRRKSDGFDVKNVEVNIGGREKKGLSQQNGGYSYWDISPSISPASFGSILMSNSSGTGFSGSSVSSNGCCSGSVTEEEEENGECLDDWEAVADALGVGDKRTDPSPKLESETPVCQQEHSCEFWTERNSTDNGTRPESLQLPMNHRGCQAWKPDDAFRPQTLPNLAKQYSCSAGNSYESGGCGSWVCRNLLSFPSSCPICYEDMDMTDTSFLPCLCGFQLCLFCHKRILEEDGRCPGCRKPYDKVGPTEAKPIPNGVTSTIGFASSFRMVAGSRKLYQ